MKLTNLNGLCYPENMDKVITSPANDRIKAIRALGQKKHRDEDGLFWVEGARHVGDAVEAGWKLETLLYTGKKPNIACRDTLQVTEEILQRITGRDNAQAVLGVFKIPQEEMGQKGLWVGLEGIKDPGNLGTIIRTADAVGAEGVLLLGNTCDPWSPEAIRATMGSFARVKIVQAKTLPWKGRIIGTHLKASIDYRKADYKLPLLIMMGSESDGLSDAVAKRCDTLVKIPMKGDIESLNLAVATGIVLFQTAPPASPS